MQGRARLRRLGAALCSGPGLTLACMLVVGYLCWPLCRGQMPLSADHPVHLARIVEAAAAWRAGAFGGWSEMWFLGFPIGQFYPPLGDLWIMAVRGFSCGYLSWAQAYALGLASIFLIYAGTCARLARQMAAHAGLGARQQILAAHLGLWAASFDAGFYREGGWSYTMDFGVWPQTLATALLWLGICEVLTYFANETRSKTAPQPYPPSVRAGLYFAAALLAHPVAMPSLVLALSVILLLCLRHPKQLEALPDVVVSGLFAALLAAWWLLPMVEDRAWMASYGWLHASLQAMVHWASEGRWTQAMPGSLGFAVALGLLSVAIRGSVGTRWVAAVGLLHWCLACRESYWLPRLDYLSEGFRHIQYQRFLIAAKPAFFACAALAVTGLAPTLARRWPRSWFHRLAWPCTLLLAAGFVGHIAVSGLDAGVGRFELRRMAGQTEITTKDYAALCQHFRTLSAAGPVKVSFVASRNSHWYMDFPVCSGARVYKQGFTPGANFVHKPEASRRELLDAADVGYVISAHPGRRPKNSRPGPSFGPLQVYERLGDRPRCVILDGPEQARCMALKAERQPFTPTRRFEMSGLGPQGAEVRLNVSGHPRWQLEFDGHPLRWREAPIFGDTPATTPEQRRAGQLRDGQALGNDGSGPTRIAVSIPRNGLLELHWRGASRLQVTGYLISALAWLCALAIAHPGLRAQVASLVARLGTPHPTRALTWYIQQPPSRRALVLLILAIFACAGLAYRWHAGRAQDAGLLSSHLEFLSAKRMRRSRVAPLKTDMVIRPALRMRARASAPAEVRFTSNELPEQVSGWVALDDDWAQARGHRGRHNLHIETRQQGGKWQTLLHQRVAHRPGRQRIEFANPHRGPQQLRIRLESDGDSSTRIGLELDLVNNGP